MRLTDEQMGLALRAFRPAPSQEFAAQLDAWAEGGFPSVKQLDQIAGSKSTRRLPSFVSRRPLLASLAAAATIVVLVGASVAGYLHERNSDVELFSGGGQELSGKDQSAPQNVPQSASGSAGTAVAPDEALPPVAPVPPNTPQPRNGRAQVQELSAALGLTTGSDTLGDAADGVVEVTNRYDGFVDSSDVHLGGTRAHAFFTLRIPATDLRAALDDLSDLGKVVSRDEGSTNVTGAYVDAGKSFREARAKVDSLLEDLRNASSASEAAAIRQQLIAARQELAASRTALRGVKQRVTYAPVTVQIRAADDDSWSIGDAADDAGNVLEAIAGGALVTLAVLVPLGALLALGWLGTRELRRRRREATLDR